MTTNKVRLLETQIEKISALSQESDGSPKFAKWLRDTQIVIQKIFGIKSRNIDDFNAVDFYPMVFSFDISEEEIRTAYFRGLNLAKSILESMISELVEFNILDEPKQDTGLITVENICRKFHLVARQLRQRHAERTTLELEDEYDVQDLFHSLLHLHFTDVRAEEYTPSYAGSSSRIDFILKDHGLAVEIKKTRRGLAAKEIGEQLSIDIMRYKSHPDCKILVCFVYDPEGRIANPQGIENDLNSNTRMTVRVIIAPRGF